MFLFTCPGCGTTLQTAADTYGSLATCPRCQQRLRVPDPDPETARAILKSAQTTRKKRASPFSQQREREPAGLVGWLAGRFARGAVGVLVFLLVCGGWFGWVHLRQKLGIHGLGDDPPSAVVVSAAQLLQDYAGREAAADEKYRDRLLEVSGTIANVGRDRGVPYLLLRDDAEGNTLRIQCFFDDLDEEDAAELARREKGQRVTVQGVCQGRFDHVRLKNCVLRE